MARPTKITDEQILAAAREIFIQEGYSAPTAKVARKAGVSEGTLFKRFGTKEELFFAALEIDTNPRWHRTAEALGDDWRGREGLVDLFVEILQFLLERLPRMMAIMGSGVHPKPSQLFKGMESDPKDRDLKVLAKLIDKQVKEKRMRTVDPLAAAEFLLGTVLFHVFETSINHEPADPSTYRRTAERTVDFIWYGLTPSDGSSIF